MPTFIMVARSRASAVLYPGQSLLVNVPHQEWGAANLVFRTRFLEKGYQVPVPQDFWVEISCSAPDSSQAVATFIGAAAHISTLLALCVNASMGLFEAELVYDVTPENEEHEFLQSFLADWPLVPVPGRRIDLDVVGAVLKAFGDHEEQARISRAAAQYSEALSRWSPFHELSCIAHLYMGVEALTKAALRHYCRKSGKSEEKLVQEWGIERTRLDSEVRRRLIFCGDDECYTKARNASDAIEHGFEDYCAIREPAKEVVLRTAAYLRKAIFDLFNLDGVVRDRLFGPDYAVPRGPLSIVRYLRGKLIGKIEDLSAADQQYPLCEWTSSLDTVSLGKNGLYAFTLKNSLKVKIGDGARFIPEHYQVWDGGTLREIPSADMLATKAVSDVAGD